MKSSPVSNLAPRFASHLSGLATDDCLVLRDERGLKIGFLNSRREFSPLHPANSYTIETWTPYTDIDAQLLAYNAGIPAFQLDRATPAQLAAYVAAVLPFLSRQP